MSTHNTSKNNPDSKQRSEKHATNPRYLHLPNQRARAHSLSLSTAPPTLQKTGKKIKPLLHHCRTRAPSPLTRNPNCSRHRSHKYNATQLKDPFDLALRHDNWINRHYIQPNPTRIARSPFVTLAQKALLYKDCRTNRSLTSPTRRNRLDARSGPTGHKRFHHKHGRSSPGTPDPPLVTKSPVEQPQKKILTRERQRHG